MGVSEPPLKSVALIAEEGDQLWVGMRYVRTGRAPQTQGGEQLGALSAFGKPTRMARPLVLTRFRKPYRHAWRSKIIRKGANDKPIGEGACSASAILLVKLSQEPLCDWDRKLPVKFEPGGDCGSLKEAGTWSPSAFVCVVRCLLRQERCEGYAAPARAASWLGIS